MHKIFGTFDFLITKFLHLIKNFWLLNVQFRLLNAKCKNFYSVNTNFCGIFTFKHKTASTKLETLTFWRSFQLFSKRNFTNCKYWFEMLTCKFEVVLDLRSQNFWSFWLFEHEDCTFNYFLYTKFRLLNYKNFDSLNTNFY